MRRDRWSETRKARRDGSAWAALALGALALCACLVTQEVSYEAVENTPRVAKIAPLASTFRVPFGPPETGCAPDEIAFRASVADLDVDQLLYWALYVNGRTANRFGDIPFTADRSEYRVTDAICLPKSAINGIPESCSVVTLVITSDLDKVGLASVNPVDLSGDTAYLHWNVLKGSEISPELEINACEEVMLPDAGIADAGADGSQSDAGPP